MALAYLITFTTYGARLHGSARGSVDDEHNVYGTPLLPVDAERERRSKKTMTEPAYTMANDRIENGPGMGPSVSTSAEKYASAALSRRG